MKESHATSVAIENYTLGVTIFTATGPMLWLVKSMYVANCVGISADGGMYACTGPHTSGTEPPGQGHADQKAATVVPAAPRRFTKGEVLYLPSVPTVMAGHAGETDLSPQFWRRNHQT